MKIKKKRKKNNKAAHPLLVSLGIVYTRTEYSVAIAKRKRGKWKKQDRERHREEDKKNVKNGKRL